jgi:hypothetical protein
MRLFPILPEFTDAGETRLGSLRVVLADRAYDLAVQINSRHAEPHGVQITGIVDVAPEHQLEDFGLHQPVWNILMNAYFDREAVAPKHEEAFRPSLAKQREGRVSGVAGGVRSRIFVAFDTHQVSPFGGGKFVETQSTTGPKIDAGSAATPRVMA